jgi:hypothetical protein
MKLVVGLLVGIIVGKNLSAQNRDSVLVNHKKIANLNIFPNPAHNKTVLALNHFAAGKIYIKVADAQGQIVREEERWVFGENDQVTIMFAWPPGIYSLIVRQGLVNLKKKLVVQ